MPDNLKPVVDQADALDPRFNDAFREYAQARGFVIDPARVRHPQDKPRVENGVRYVRGNFFAGGLRRSRGLPRPRRALVHPRRGDAHPADHPRPPGRGVRRARCRCWVQAPDGPFAIPTFSKPKVARDRHVEVSRALYSVPGASSASTSRHGRTPTRSSSITAGSCSRSTPASSPAAAGPSPADLPDEVSAYALRDLSDGLARRAAGYGGRAWRGLRRRDPSTPLPWTKMRQVYRLLGLARRHGAAETDTACARALEVEVINVGLIERMLTRGLAGVETMTRAQPASPRRRHRRHRRQLGGHAGGGPVRPRPRRVQHQAAVMTGTSSNTSKRASRPPP